MSGTNRERAHKTEDGSRNAECGIKRTEIEILFIMKDSTEFRTSLWGAK